MTTLEVRADLPSAQPSDFVSTDAANLASHMSHCAHSRGRFFAVFAAFESAHSAAHPRIVTVAVLGWACLALLLGV